MKFIYWFFHGIWLYTSCFSLWTTLVPSLLRWRFKWLKLSRDRVQPTLYDHSENDGSWRYGCFSKQIPVVAFRMKMIVRSYIGISMAFDYTLRGFFMWTTLLTLLLRCRSSDWNLVAMAYNQHFTIIVKMAVDDTDAFRRKLLRFEWRWYW
jgi:hypothetical protein